MNKYFIEKELGREMSDRMQLEHLSRLHDVAKKASENGWTDIYFRTENYKREPSSLVCMGTRPMTAGEMTREDARVEKNALMERELYDRLKKKFEG
jgi:hypothetical protein